MTLCLDIHTHHPAPQQNAVISMPVEEFDPMEGQWYSVGIHPWLTKGLTKESISKETWNLLEKLASIPQVVAIGECGIDKVNGGFLFQQLIVLQKQINLSETLGKPLILHDVKAHDVITGLKRDLKPKQNWAVHGFRGKPTVAKMLTDAGIYLSYGEKFNPESLPVVPQHMILAETDESLLSIEEIIANLSVAAGKDMTEIIAANTARFLGFDRKGI